MTHPDLERLEAIKEQMNNGDPEDPHDPHFSTLMSSSVDEASLITHAHHSVVLCAEMLSKKLSPELIFSTLMALYAEAFVSGVQFQRAGGHRERE